MPVFDRNPSGGGEIKGIVTPVLTKPVAGEFYPVCRETGHGYGFPFESSVDFYSTIKGSYHYSTTYQLAIDSAFNDIRVSNTYTEDDRLKSVTIVDDADPRLPNGPVTVYARCRYSDQNGNHSGWSKPVTCRVASMYVTPGGRLIWRNSTNNATWMRCRIRNTTQYFEVVDASLRSNAQVWGKAAQYADVGTSDYGLYASLVDGRYFNNTTTTKLTTSTASTITDSELDTYFNRFISQIYNMTTLTTTLYNNSSNNKAAHFVRGITINGKACDLPTAAVLARIYCDAEAIDAIDPTVSSNRTRALGSMNTNGYWRMNYPDEGIVYTCEESRSDPYFAVAVGRNGCMYFFNKNWGAPVVPVVNRN